jgi:hypothetical protein
MDAKLPRIAFLLGLSGLLPQIMAAAICLHPPHAAFGQFAAFLYAALIFSFLGGLWWGIAAVKQTAPRWLYGAAVMPTLISFGAGLLWIVRGGSAGPSLIIVGLGLLLSPLIDWQLDRQGLVPGRWLTMRIILSLGLGALTVLAAILR